MGIQQKINEGAGQTTLKEQLRMFAEFMDERNAIADRYLEKWKRVPEIGKELKQLPENKARKLAVLLENQAQAMSRLNETQYASAFSATPENMIRLVRLTYPNSIRDEAFTDFVMETAQDSIKYIKPVYTANSNINRHSTTNPWADTDVTYESQQSDYPTEIAQGVRGTPGGDVNFTFTAAEFTGGFVPGYTTIYGAGGAVIAVEARDYTWTYASGYNSTNFNIAYNSSTKVYLITGASKTDGLTATGRYNSDPDTAGTYLGEVELQLTSYQFKPRPTTLGVSWTTLSELILDKSFGVSAEEILLDSAGQEIKKALDFQAVKIAYNAALTNGYSPVAFDAEAGAGTDDSYIHTAQTVTQAIERVGDVIYNDINRGGVSRIIGGPAACMYLRLNAGFDPADQQPRIGAYKVGNLNGIPVFKVPSAILPDSTLMTVWKNDENEADVALAFGVLVPFWTTGVIQRKNFYKEAGIASYQDWQVLNNKYFGRVAISNIRGI
jgi:hypothetical protein